MMSDINRDLLLSRILHAGGFTALEKRFLANLVQRSRTGQWIEDEYGFFHCSVCGWEFDDPEQTEPDCPNCGARCEISGADGTAERCGGGLNMFIEVTGIRETDSGRVELPTLLNKEDIACVWKKGDGCVIRMRNDTILNVKDSYEALRVMLLRVLAVGNDVQEESAS